MPIEPAPPHLLPRSMVLMSFSNAGGEPQAQEVTSPTRLEK